MPVAAHVVIAVQAQFDGTAAQISHDRRDDGPLRRLGFLAAKRATHAAHLDRHGIHRSSKRACDEVLDLGRMLGRGQYQHIPVFLRQGHGDLAFQVKVVLATGADLALQTAGRRRECGLRVTPLHVLGFEHVGFFRQRGLDVEDGRQFLVLDPRQFGGTPGDRAALGQYCKQGLSGKLHQVLPPAPVRQNCVPG